MNASGRRWRFAQTLLALVLVAFAAWYLWEQWQSASTTNLRIHFHAGWLSAASLAVVGTYGFLIEIWRRVLARMGSRISFSDASRIWFVSNLGKYVPGKVWQVTTMAAMLNRRGVGLASAGSAAAVITIANVAAGFGLLLVVGVPAMKAVNGSMQPGVLIATLVLLVALLAAAFNMRFVSRLAERVLRRPVSLTMPLPVVLLSVGGCAVAWLLYGVAFELFTISLLGPPRAPWLSYVAAYTVSYLVGYLVLISPGGLGPREAVLAAVLIALNMATPAEATVVTVASRLWLTVLEIIPGLLYLMVPPHTTVDGAVDARP